MDAALQSIHEKVQNEQRIDADDCRALFASNDLLALGRIANLARERKNGNRAFYNINRHINYSNVCYVDCKFCEFGQPKSSPKAYELSMSEMERMGREAAAQGATEFHIVGGLHPDLKLDYYENLLRTFKSVAPGVHLKAFTAVEIDYFAKISRLSVEEVLKRLIAAGLGSMPGGGAEVMTERVRKLVFPNKIGAERWLEIHRIAHGLGLRSNATLLYGHVENDEDKVVHLQKLRDLQDETGGFQTFIPLSFVPYDTQLAHLPPPTGLSDLKHIAISRIFLDNFAHVKVYWIMTGIKVAQLALNFGADDIDGTVMQERIVHMAGAETPEGLHVDELVKLIREAGREPVERDTLYNIVSRAA
ncbi:MAG: aminofutalosine synthase MqnE [Deltaproteobacteria bacterium]|nr:aminofutalosine synthase MqnE [Deltaproteobacteria bacterium]